jgi:hypothetical protein
MKVYKSQLCLLIILCIFCTGCFSKSPSVFKQEEIKWAENIAVVPVENKTKDNIASGLLRSKLLDELYFKGYSKISLETIDQKLESLNIIDSKGNGGVIAPQILKDLVGADAVMYCTLIESNKSIGFVYAPVSIYLTCELRRAESGEVIWKGQYKSTSRNFDFTRKGLEMKSCKAYESVIEEVVNKIMENFPYGPNLKG